MQANLDDPLIGKTFSGRFEIVAAIGAGGMGRIYRAVERRIDRLVALKVLQPRHDTANDKSYESRFFLEARMTAKLRHPNTVTLYDYGRSEDGIYFMALELLEGETLQQALRREGPMSWPRALSIGAQVARSLREAHHLGLVHRDLKPSNIMLVPEGPLGDRVKVLDFGLVKTVTPIVETSPAELELTDEGVVLGSPLYMAPEQARKAIDPRSDVYSLGAVLFAVMSGRTPFVGKKPFDLMLKHMHEQPPELSSLTDVPPLVNALVMRCLEKAPEARFQNMDELLVAMHQAVNALGFGGLFVTQRPGPWDSREARQRRVEVERVTPPFVRPPPVKLTRWKTVLAGAVLAGGALGAVVATTAKRSRASTVTQSPVATPPPVVFDVSSEPSGATVMSGNQSVGVTPLRLSRPREDGAAVRLRLALVLPGYETAVLAVEGKDELVRVHQVLAPNPLVAGRPTSATKPQLPNPVTTPDATAPGTTEEAPWATTPIWMIPSAETPAVGATPTDQAPRSSEAQTHRHGDTAVTAAVPPKPNSTTRRKPVPPTVKATTRVEPAATKGNPASVYREDPYEQ